jgi:hypothetical protein
MRVVDLARGRAVLLLARRVPRSTLPPEVVVVVPLRTRLESPLRQFVLVDARDADESAVLLVSLVIRAALLESVMLLIAVGHGPLLRCAVLVLLLVFCAAIPGATNAPSPTTIAVIRW